MGSCVSVHKETDSAMKLGFSVESKNEQLLIPPPPVKQVSGKVNGGDRTLSDLALKSHWSPSPPRDTGSKDDAFFDSQPWLESDCEDEFLSVNGDFTPSRGNTPVHHKFSSANPHSSKTESSPPPPSEKKKKLSELFKESLRNHNYEDEQNSPEATSLVPPKPASETSSHFAASDGVLGQEDDSVRAGQCCLPRLRSSRSLNEKKKKSSPAHSNG